MSRIGKAASVLLCMVISQHIGATHPSGIATQLTPDAIISHARLDLLADEPYRHPVHPDPVEGESYLELRKWDLVFTGPLPGHSSNINNIIPGRYDHTIAYVSKDASGYAYFVELTQSSLSNSEPIKLFSAGKDFGEDRHPSGDRFWSDFSSEYRWAKTFRDEIRVQVLAQDKALTAQVMQELKAENVVEFANRVGIQSKLDPVPSLCLGTSDVSLYELVGAYATFVNSIYTEPFYITLIEDNNGNVIEIFNPITPEALNEQTAR